MIGENLQHKSNAKTLDDLLELQRSDGSDSQNHNRANERFGVQCRIELRPANSTQRNADPIAGICSDLSAGGCRLISTTPAAVGDIYWMSFDNIDTPSVFARCIRCRLLNEDAFEAGFQFFSEIALPDSDTDVSASDDLVDIL